jgi:hypothetical protein
MGILDFIRRKKIDPEVARRAALLKGGRIAEGTISDIATDENGAITHVYYSYHISGVEYESSQTLDADQLKRAADYFPGARITIRFNPQRPGNSVVV